MTKATEPRQLGWLDACLFIHPLFQNDPNAARCREIFRAIEKGAAESWLDSVTVHELTYALQKLPQFRDNRGAIVDYLLPFVLQEGIRMSDKPAVVSGLRHWTRGGRFGDARIAALAETSGLPVCTVNARDWREQESPVGLLASYRVQNGANS
ncbi:MAG: type II toxin-antitoxin system VapC family toxin [Symbiobacteriia bacterium]